MNRRELLQALALGPVGALLPAAPVVGHKPFAAAAEALDEYFGVEGGIGTFATGPVFMKLGWSGTAIVRWVDQSGNAHDFTALESVEFDVET